VKTGCTYMENLEARKHPLCPERTTIVDEWENRGIVVKCTIKVACKVSRKKCLLEIGMPCTIYEDFLLKVKER